MPRGENACLPRVTRELPRSCEPDSLHTGELAFVGSSSTARGRAALPHLTVTLTCWSSRQSQCPSAKRYSVCAEQCMTCRILWKCGSWENVSSRRRRTSLVHLPIRHTRAGLYYMRRSEQVRWDFVEQWLDRAHCDLRAGVILLRYDVQDYENESRHRMEKRGRGHALGRGIAACTE